MNTIAYRWKIAGVATAVLGCGILIAEPAQALSFNNVTDLTGITSDLTAGAQEDNNNIYLYQERSNFTLTSDLNYNLDGSNGTFTGGGLDSSSGSIASGTSVKSFYIFFDPVGSDGALSSTPSITFDNPILGIQTKQSQVGDGNSDVGLNTVSYENPAQQIGGDDQLTISGNTITFNNLSIPSGGNSQDAIRVVTAVPFEAETGIGLVLLGSYLGWRRFRRRKQALASDN
ncbi:MAG: hypothetical protein GVY17_03940 [Cyanobacteria bacterium]|jgi:hypothetical protein|nr:hypothetical protein [Cyanobacteria bacterium GSL.Bin21]